MSLEQLARKALHARRLDSETVRRIQRYVDRGDYLTPEEYEALRSLGRGVRSGEIQLGA